MLAPTITVYTATGGQEQSDGNSTVGHAYYVLTSSSGVQTSYGFAPVSQGSPYGPGKLTDRTGPLSDLNQYSSLTYSASTTVLTDAEFNTLQSYGTDPQSYGFSMQYNVLTNNCINFVWGGLSTIGIANPTHFPGQETLPSWNGAFFQQAIDARNAGQIAAGSFTPTQETYDGNGNLVESIIRDNNGNLISTTTYFYTGDGQSGGSQTTDANGNVVQSVTASLNISDGSANFDGKNFDSAGNISGEEAIASSSGGQENISFYGTGITVDAANSSIGVQAGSHLILNGTNDVVSADSNAQVQIDSQDSGEIDVSGNNIAVVDFATSGAVGLVGGNSTLSLVGPGETGTLAGDSSAAFAYGDSESVSISDDNNFVNLGGSSDNATLSGTRDLADVAGEGANIDATGADDGAVSTDGDDFNFVGYNYGDDDEGYGPGASFGEGAPMQPPRKPVYDGLGGSGGGRDKELAMSGRSADLATSLLVEAMSGFNKENNIAQFSPITHQTDAGHLLAVSQH